MPNPFHVVHSTIRETPKDFQAAGQAIDKEAADADLYTAISNMAYAARREPPAYYALPPELALPAARPVLLLIWILMTQADGWPRWTIGCTASWRRWGW